MEILYFLTDTERETTRQRPSNHKQEDYHFVMIETKKPEKEDVLPLPPACQIKRFAFYMNANQCMMMNRDIPPNNAVVK